MFLPTKLHYILNKDYSKKEAENEVSKYVKERFKTEKRKITQDTESIKKGWELAENKYFDLVNIIFKNHPWPKGKYIGYASVFNMYPRNVQDKIFYFPGLHTSSRLGVQTISHEMLHFMFFDYLKTKYGISEDDEFEGKNPKYVWNISETFNLVIEAWKPYQKILKTKSEPYDPVHKRMFPRMKKLWDEKNDIDYLLSHYF
jgi:hypothetical protein